MMFRLLPFAVSAILLALHCMACPGASHPAEPPSSKPNNVLATLGGAEIRESDFDRFLQDGWPAEGSAEVRRNPVARKEALDAYLDLAVMAAKARKDGIDRTPVFQKARELMEMKILVKLFADRDRDRLSKSGSVTDKELRDYYNQHTDQFLAPPSFTARQILVYVKGNPAFPEKGLDDAGAAAKAREALGKLRAGETWESAAKTYSDDTGTNQRGGLMENAPFGYFPPEVEAALRRQKLGQPGGIVKSQFGYHVLQVERRTAEGEREPFEKVKETIARRISDEKSSAARKAYMDPIRAEMDLKETPAAARDVSLLDSSAVKPDEILATLAGAPIREADFQWFIRDAYRPEQRTYVFSRPGARREMLDSYLSMRVMEAKARKENLDKEPAFESACALMEMKLLAEFLQERDKTSPWRLPGATEAERMAALKKHANQLRTEMGLKESSAAETARRR